MNKTAGISTILLTLLFAGCGGVGDKYNQVAQCLTDKGVVMYGAFWCPHCSNQKKSFGKAFELIKYVECDPRGEDPQPDLCLQKDIKSYPTWIFADETRLTGEVDPEVLAERAECPLPVEPPTPKS